MRIEKILNWESRYKGMQSVQTKGLLLEYDYTLTFASSLTKSSSTLCESPFAAALTSSSTASPGTCVSNNFFRRADNLSAIREPTLNLQFCEYSTSETTAVKDLPGLRKKSAVSATS